MKSAKPIYLFLSAAAVALAACSPATNGQNGSEAGHMVDEGNFGKPTFNNLLVQSAYRDQNGLLMDLARKFEKEVPTMVNFDFNASKLDSQTRATLDQQAEWIKQFPEIKFRVYGHTDLVGTKTYNQGLGLKRANNVVKYLISRGIKSDRLEAVASFGETQPLIVTEGRERRNRRTVTEVIGFARNYVGDGMDGKLAHLIYRNYVGDKISTVAATSTN